MSVSVSVSVSVDAAWASDSGRAGSDVCVCVSGVAVWELWVWAWVTPPSSVVLIWQAMYRCNDDDRVVDVEWSLLSSRPSPCETRTWHLEWL